MAGKMKISLLKTAVVVSCFCFCQQAVARTVELLWDGELLSIQATDVTLAEISQQLSDKTGIVFSVSGTSSATISIDIVAEPLATAITKISSNHMLVRDGDSADARLVEVVFLISDNTSTISTGNFLPSGAPAADVQSDAQRIDPASEQPGSQSAQPQNILENPDLQPSANSPATIRAAQ